MSIHEMTGKKKQRGTGGDGGGDAVPPTNNHVNSSGSAELDLFTDNDIDDALNFDLDFDAVAQSLADGPLAHIDFGDFGSLGTRSPSPSHSETASAVSSKRSRADFDSESECDSARHSVRNKRMVFHSGPESGLSLHPHPSFQDTEGGYDGYGDNIQHHREQEGRCHICGLETHELVGVTGMGNPELKPLTIDGEVLNGRCLLCNPLTEGESITQVGVKSGSGSKSKHTPQPPPRGNNRRNNNRGAPPSQQQQWQNRSDHSFEDTSNNNMRSRAGKFTPTPNQFHSKMALAKQAQLPRNHSSVEHAKIVFGSTNNRRKVKTPRGPRGAYDPPPGGEQLMAMLGQSDSSFYDNNVPMKVMSCMETNQSPVSPLTPHTSRRSPSDPPSRKTLALKTPQSVPMNMKDNSLRHRAPSSGSVSNRSLGMPILGGGGGETSSMGALPYAFKEAHSKLSSSIYHHHLFMNDEASELAHIEKTLIYLESGSGDICDIVVAMRRFPFNIPVQRSACEKLYAHCFDQEHAHAIGLVGGIRTIIDSMEHHPNDAELQVGCIDVIKHLAMASTYNTEMLDRMGAVGIIVATMERHSNDAKLLESCCWAMESLSQNPSPELKMRLGKSGGIHAAMKAVETFPNNESLLRAAFHCLRQLGYNPSQYNKLSSTGSQGSHAQSFRGGGSVGGSSVGREIANLAATVHQNNMTMANNNNNMMRNNNTMGYNNNMNNAMMGINTNNMNNAMNNMNNVMNNMNNVMMGMGNNSQRDNSSSNSTTNNNNRRYRTGDERN